MTVDFFLLVLLTCLLAIPLGIAVGWFGRAWMDRHHPIGGER